MRIVDSGGTKRTVKSLRIFDGTSKRRVLKIRQVKSDLTKQTIATFAVAMSAQVIPTSASTTTGGTTNTVSATPTGGEAPFTYSWAITTAPSGGAVTITRPTMASTAFSQNTALDADNTGQATVTITDSLGTTAQAVVDLSFQNEDIT